MQPLIRTRIRVYQGVTVGKCSKSCVTYFWMRPIWKLHIIGVENAWPRKFCQLSKMVSFLQYSAFKILGCQFAEDYLIKSVGFWMFNNITLQTTFLPLNKFDRCLQILTLTITARCCFSIPPDFRGYRKATPGCNGLKASFWQKGISILYLRKVFQKTNISNALHLHIHMLVLSK